MLHPARSQHDADMYALAERFRAAASGGGLATDPPAPPVPVTDWRHPDEQVRVVPPPDDDVARVEVESIPMFTEDDPDADPFALDEPEPAPTPRRRGRPRKTAG